jgi:hypothetical protein
MRDSMASGRRGYSMLRGCPHFWAASGASTRSSKGCRVAMGPRVDLVRRFSRNPQRRPARLSGARFAMGERAPELTRASPDLRCSKLRPLRIATPASAPETVGFAALAVEGCPNCHPLDPCCLGHTLCDRCLHCSVAVAVRLHAMPRHHQDALPCAYSWQIPSTQ